MADSNNELVGKLPKTPNPALKKFERLVGKWRITGDDVDGESTFEWMEGGFFLIQHFDLKQGGSNPKGVEYTGFDEDTQTLRSHLMGTDGSNFTYTYDIEGDTFWYWFGDKNPHSFSRSTFSEDGNSYSGRWQWTEADGKSFSYEYTATRVNTD